MDTRRRRPSASGSTNSGGTPKARGAALRNVSASATPVEEDEEKGRRSTRKSNPLPPSVGPLFPPLPPKQPKSKTTPSVKTDLDNSQSTDTLPDDSNDSEQANAEVENGDDDKSEHPAGSVNSLTPPPPTSEDANMDMDVDQPADEGADNESGEAKDEVENGSNKNGDAASDEWSAYHRNRSARGFGAAKDVKPEPEDEDDGQEDIQETPKRNSRAKGQEAEQAEEPEEEEGTPAAPVVRKRRGEEQLLLDDHLLPAELRKTGAITGKRGRVKEEEEPEPEGEGEGDEGEEDFDEGDEVTRCVCKTEDNDIMMISCDKCNVWQHGPCMGVWADEEVPEEYFCEECKPELHGPLRKYLRSKGRNATFIPPPTPADLQKFHNSSDKYPPSQSKRWTDPELADPPPKPAARSHHRKSDTNEEANEGRRGARGRNPPANRDKPVSAGKPEGRRGGRGTETRGRNVAIASPSPTKSPPAPGAPPKRRSTMNSRDTAYEDQVRAALEASRTETTNVEPSETEEKEEKVEEKAPSRKGKRKREEDDTASVAEQPSTPAPPPVKAKHPNQYTYRPKPASGAAAASPARRSGPSGTPVPSLPPPAQHDHGTRRAGAIANGIIPPPPNAVSVHNLHWHLPDHLSAYSDVLPNPQPIALESRASRPMQYLPRNHFLNQKYGPFTEDRDEEGKLILPEEPTPREPIGEPTLHLEPPARVRYPVKRITTGELRKRIRNMLEYVGRVQGEEGKRKERAKLIGIDPSKLPPAKRTDKDGEELAEDAVPQMSFDVTSGPSGETLLDELMRDLIGFQESVINGVEASPLPPSLAQFVPLSAPSTPRLGSKLAFETTAPEETTSVVENGKATDKPAEVTADPEAIADAAQVDPETAQAPVEEQPPVAGVAPEEEEAHEDVEMAVETKEAEGVVEEPVVSDVGAQLEVYREGAVDEVLEKSEEVGVEPVPA